MKGSRDFIQQIIRELAHDASREHTELTLITNCRGRKLTWLWQLSNNEIKMTFTKPNYILMASSYQTAVLLQFNDTHSLSYAELSEATNLADAQLKPVLNLLVKAKLLLVDGDQYDLNTSKFSSSSIMQGF
jgi:cullin 1